ncbi:arylsulfatase [Labilibaculum sp.]|uniref:arylsulfatase n=1 Tax=Labilibaculum sp. TaxID=2060723 RepID=UPI003568EBCA
MKTFVQLLLGAFLIITTFSCQNAEKEKKEETSKPNIIFILTDDLGFGDLGYYGQKKIKTPNLDHMASKSLVFSNAYAGGPVCSPSRASLMTGLHQGHSPVRNNPPSGSEEVSYGKDDVILSQKMKQAGYTTACFGKWGGPQSSEGYPTKKGFDKFIGYDTHKWAHNYYSDTLRSNDTLIYPKRDYPQFMEDGKVYSHDIFIHESLNFIEENQNDPFFLYLAITIPHSPYNPPKSYLEPYKDKDWPMKYKRYAGMVSKMDYDVNRILQKLDELGIAENTLVIFTSDNGPQSSYGKGENDMTQFFNSNGKYRGIKRDILEGGVHVPFWAYWKGKIEPKETDHTTCFFDVMPTLCELVGVDAPENTDGYSILPTIYGDVENQKEHDYFYWEYMVCWAGKENEACRYGVLDIKNNMKAIKYGKYGDTQLFNIKTDTTEQINIADKHPELVEKLNAKMVEMRDSSDIWILPKKPFFAPKNYNSHYTGDNRWVY